MVGLLAIPPAHAQPVTDTTLLPNPLPGQPGLTHPTTQPPKTDSTAQLSSIPPLNTERITVREAVWVTSSIAALTVLVLLLFNVRSR